MASKYNYSAALRNAKMDAITAHVGSGAVIKLYDNTAAQPAGPGTAVPGGSILLATWTESGVFAPSASNGVLSPTLPSNVNAVATGTPGWFRVFKSDGTTACIDGSAGASATDMIVTGSIVSGQPVQMNSWSITDGNASH